MFDLPVVLLVFAVAVPGIVLTVPRSLKQMSKTLEARLPEGKKLPPLPVLAALQVVQSLVLVAGLAAVGGVFVPRIGFAAPVFEALAHHRSVAEALPPPVPLLGLSVAGSALFLVLYYAVFRRRLDAQTAANWDRLRNQLGIGSRLLYGGIVEEVMMRWGLMSLVVWLIGFVPGLPERVVVWLSILIIGVLFGLAHAPSYLAAGCRRSRLFFTAMISLNLLAGIIFGYLFFRHGLAAAIVSHMLFHLFWYPFDIALSRRPEAAADRADQGVALS